MVIVSNKNTLTVALMDFGATTLPFMSTREQLSHMWHLVVKCKITCPEMLLVNIKTSYLFCSHP